MRLLFVVHGFPPEQPGVWTYHHVRELAARHEICAIVLTSDLTRKHLEQWQVVDGNVLIWRLNIHSIDSLRGFANTQIDDIFDYALEYFSPDVVHFEHVIGLSATMLTRTYRRHIPSVLAMYDYYWVCPRIHLVRGDHSLCAGPSHVFDCVTCLEGPGTAPPVRRQFNEGERGCVNSVGRASPPSVEPWRLLAHDFRLSSMHALLEYPDIVTACSHSLRDDLTEMLDLPADRIRTVPLGVPPLAHSVAHVPSDCVRIRYLGAVAPHKGVHVLAAATRLLADLPIAVHLHGAADPSYLAEVVTQNGAVICHGAYNHDDLADILNETDILVLPSLARETFSFILREAALAQVPVIASRIGAIPEFIREDESGLLVTPGSVDELAAALRRLVTDAGLRARLAAAAAPIRSIEDYTAEMEGIYATLDRARQEAEA